MAKHSAVLVLTLAAVFTGCQATPATQDDEGVQARYVEATELASGASVATGDVLTSVKLRHISAVDAEAGIKHALPEGVRVARVGQSKSLLIQGPAQAVAVAIKALRSLDVPG